MNLESFKPEHMPLRPGMGISEVVDLLQRDPEIELSVEDREEVLGYEQELTKSNELLLRSGEKVKGIEHIWQLSAKTSEFYQEYFLTEGGREDLENALGRDIPQFRSLNEVEEYFYGLDYTNITTEALKGLSGRSKQYGENAVVEQFANNNFESLDGVENPTKLNIVHNPHVVAQKVQSLRRLKQYYKEQTDDLVGNTDSASQAKLTVLTLHRRRLNELLTEEYPNIVHFFEQYKSSPQENLKEVHEMLADNIRGTGLFDDERQFRTLGRLDKFRQGVGERQYGGDYSPINPQLAELVKEAEEMLGRPQPVENFVFNDVDPKLFWEKKITATEFQHWVELSLKEYGILSADEQYDHDRIGRTSDNGWQVVIDDSVGNLSVDSKQGVIKVPTSFHRSIAGMNPAGAVPVLDHEITHVLQHENKERLGLSITEKVGLDRSSVNSEAGAMLIESETQRELFGQQVIIDMHYFRALERKLQGGNLVECMKAFFDSVRQESPDRDKREVAKHAINRAARQFRDGGAFADRSPYPTNTQPLVYMEQELIARELVKQNSRDLLMIAGVNMEALAMLHSVGLFDREKIKIPSRKPSQIIMEEIQEKLHT